MRQCAASSPQRHDRQTSRTTQQVNNKIAIKSCGTVMFHYFIYIEFGTRDCCFAVAIVIPDNQCNVGWLQSNHCCHHRIYLCHFAMFSNVLRCTLLLLPNVACTISLSSLSLLSSPPLPSAHKLIPLSAGNHIIVVKVLTTSVPSDGIFIGPDENYENEQRANRDDILFIPNIALFIPRFKSLEMARLCMQSLS